MYCRSQEVKNKMTPWKMTSIFQEMEVNFKFLGKRRQLNLSGNGGQPQLGNVDFKFPIKNNLQINQSQPSST